MPSVPELEQARDGLRSRIRTLSTEPDLAANAAKLAQVQSLYVAYQRTCNLLAKLRWARSPSPRIAALLAKEKAALKTKIAAAKARNEVFVVLQAMYDRYTALRVMLAAASAMYGQTADGTAPEGQVSSDGSDAGAEALLAAAEPHRPSVSDTPFRVIHVGSNTSKILTPPRPTPPSSRPVHHRDVSMPASPPRPERPSTPPPDELERMEPGARAELLRAPILVVDDNAGGWNRRQTVPDNVEDGTSAEDAMAVDDDGPSRVSDAMDESSSAIDDSSSIDDSESSSGRCNADSDADDLTRLTMLRSPMVVLAPKTVTTTGNWQQRP
ncbi:uncharacterized protein AMSG_07450 [Thecamonas trahens ATCC 50062]|uniref:Uncharacterized protein n=1 Tax=Thecamonas trahens ATCC 50062 TaxID=461836 RepID=A0A0L0DH60_THETB|nr:hypothetical protein AMSG_07450 [Thecamonas trahens ATCC 50062]KNC51550.1 hypothetical protein AMSG_07450 [Thecamonas trahens ATCC 50062]|eukprot:XP_013755952.1 hypothetical protein AMSG_07450 [Thecamonas trahens ATCC 50062]